MSKLTTVCPHCGKVLSSPDKLARHLSRECPELINLTRAGASSKGAEQPTKR
jgi:phage FluMu protein Com